MEASIHSIEFLASPFSTMLLLYKLFDKRLQFGCQCNKFHTRCLFLRYVENRNSECGTKIHSVVLLTLNFLAKFSCNFCLHFNYNIWIVWTENGLIGNISYLIVPHDAPFPINLPFTLTSPLEITEYERALQMALHDRDTPMNMDVWFCREHF